MSLFFFFLDSFCTLVLVIGVEDDRQTSKHGNTAKPSVTSESLAYGMLRKKMIAICSHMLKHFISDGFLFVCFGCH